MQCIVGTLDVLRNNYRGKTIEQAIGIKPIISSERIFHKLKGSCQELQEKIGLARLKIGLDCTRIWRGSHGLC